MPVAIEMEFEGATLEQYEQVMELMGLENGGQAPPAPSSTGPRDRLGPRVVDVWESREAFDGSPRSRSAEDRAAGSRPPR